MNNQENTNVNVESFSFENGITPSELIEILTKYPDYKIDAVDGDESNLGGVVNFVEVSHFDKVIYIWGGYQKDI